MNKLKLPPTAGVKTKELALIIVLLEKQRRDDDETRLDYRHCLGYVAAHE